MLQTPTDDDDRHQQPLQSAPYTVCRRASNKILCVDSKLVSEVIWQKAASPCGRPSKWRMHLSVACAGQAHSSAAAGEQCRMHVCVSALHTMSLRVSFKTTTSRGVYGSPCNICFWAHTSLPLKRHLDRFSPVFARLTRVSNPHRHADHATCNICSNRPHLCTACRRRSLIGSFRGRLSP